MTIPSPCRKICVYDPGAGWCRGCGRTLAEIGAWSQLSDGEREVVLAASARRLDGREHGPIPAPS